MKKNRATELESNPSGARHRLATPFLIALAITTLAVGSVVIWTRAQSQEGGASEPAPGPQPEPRIPPYIAVSPETYEVISPDGDPRKVAAFNTAELINQRRQAVFAITHPGNLADQPGITPEQVADALRAAAVMEAAHPD